jgi:hypothetical protein
MDVIAILTGQRRAVERLYDEAAGVFAARKKKIEAAEEPYQPPPFNPDYDDPEPPFLEEWLEADEFQDIVGQACLSIVQSCLKDYLDGVLERSGIEEQVKKFMSQRRNHVKDESWFGRYLAFFALEYSIDWTKCPVPTEDLEEINLARNDIQHGRPTLGLGRYRGEKHQRFPVGLFVRDHDRKLSFGHAWTQVHVSPER